MYCEPLIEMSSTRDVVVSTDGVPIRYEVFGRGAPTLIFVHGWSCDRSYWEKQLGRFAQRYQVVAIDLAGHGESGLDRKTWSLTAFAQDIVAVVEELALQRVVLVGHSMGGRVIVEAARRMPTRVVGLVGVDSLNNLGHIRTQKEIEDRLAPFHANFVEATRDLVRTMFVQDSDPALVDRIVADMSAAPPHVGIGALEGSISSDLNIRQALQELKAPTIVINSDHRPTDMEAASRYGIRVMWMSGVGHFVMLEDPETFNRLLDDAVGRFAQAEA